MRCITAPNFVKIGQMVFEISPFFIFQDGGRRHLGFQKFSNFIASGIRRADLHHHAKFHQNLSTRCRDLVVFRFLKMQWWDSSFLLVICVKEIQSVWGPQTVAAHAMEQLAQWLIWPLGAMSQLFKGLDNGHTK